MNELQFGMLVGELVTKRANLLSGEENGFAGRGDLVLYEPQEGPEVEGATALVSPVRALVLKYHGAAAGELAKAQLQLLHRQTGEPVGSPISQVTRRRFFRAPRPKNQPVTRSSDAGILPW